MKKYPLFVLWCCVLGLLWNWFPNPQPETFGQSRGLASREANETCMRILDVLYDRSKGLLKDHERSTSYFYPGRTIRAFESANAQELDALFDTSKGGISYDEFIDLYWSIKSGEFRVQPYQEKFIDDMHHMIDDHGPFFWHQENRVYHILETLRRTDQNWDMIQGRNASALATEKALALTEKNIIERALGEHSGRKYSDWKWYHRFRNFFFPHYKKILSLVEYNTAVRKRLQLMYMADEPFDHVISALTRSGDYEISPQDLSKLRDYVGDTGSKLNEARGEIQRIYSGELTTEKPIRPDAVNLSELDRTLKAFKSESGSPMDKVHELFTGTNRELDELDTILNRSYRREQTGPYSFYPTRDAHNTHLKIRFDHYTNRTGETRGAHRSYLANRHPRNADYDITIEWTVTVRHEREVTKTRPVTRTDAQGNTKTEIETYQDTEVTYSTYQESRVDTLQASYAEIFDNRITPDISKVPALPYPIPRGINAVSATNGSPSIRSVNQSHTNRILSAASETRKAERPFMDYLSDQESMISSMISRYQAEILGNDGESKKAIDLLEDTLEETIDRAKALDQYKGQSASAVQSRWSNDVKEHFDSRHRHMKERYEVLIQRLRHLREQILREHQSLGVDYILPDHSVAVERLRVIHQRYRRIQIGMGVGTVAAGGAVGADLYMGANEPGYESKTQQFFDFVDRHFKSVFESSPEEEEYFPLEE